MIDNTNTVPSPTDGNKEIEPEGVPGCVAAMTGAACAPLSQSGNGASDGGGSQGSGWWRGVWSTARNQSASMMGFMRRDLNEFVSTVRSDTKDAVQRTANVVRESVNSDTANVASSRLKSGLNRFLDTVSSAMTIPPDDSEEEALVYREGGWHPAKSRREGRILSLRMNPETYETVPADEQFSSWCETFSVDEKKSEISELLISNSEVRAIYSRLVPQTILHREFWARYYFRLQSLEAEEDRWAALKERAGRQDATADWGDDWDEEAPAAVTQLSETPNVEPEVPPAAASSVAITAAEPVPPEDAKKFISMELTTDNSPSEPPATVEVAPDTRQVPTSESVDTPPDSMETGKVDVDADAGVDDRFRVMEKSDVVVVKHKDSPESSSDGSGSAGVPEALPETNERQLDASMDAKDLEEWEAELDAEVTAEEIEEAKKTARELKDANELVDRGRDGKDDDEDWENWE